jgi:tetratricopeptide (TPR) repeat protein
MLTLTTGYDIPTFSRDGRILVQRGDERQPWRVEPALEYVTLAHAAGSPLSYQRPSINRDGRILAVGTDKGVVLWDLETRAELAFLAIGLAWHSAFSVTGDLLTNGDAGFLRWPVRIDPETGRYHIGPPLALPLPGTDCAIDEDREGRAVAMADHAAAYVALGNRPMSIAPLEDCRGVAISPGGEWLATGSHTEAELTIWKLPEGTRVGTLPTSQTTHTKFSPDGRWLMCGEAPCRLFEVSSWRQVRQFDGRFQCFAQDGHLAAVVDASNVLLLVEIESGRVLARLQSPDQHPIGAATFSPDGSRLVETSRDPPCAHVWDLRAIRRQLVEMKLDWDAPPLPDASSSNGDGVGPPVKLDVDFGFLKNLGDGNAVPVEVLIAPYTELLRRNPENAESLHQRGHALLKAGRVEEALADFSAASTRLPKVAHPRAFRGMCLLSLKRYALAIDHLEAAFGIDPSAVRAIPELHRMVNERARELATGPPSVRDPILASRLAAFAVALAPDDHTSLNTLGVAQYRAGQYAEAIANLEKSLAAGHGQLDAFDLFFLAMAHRRLGHRAEARACFDRAVRWVSEQKTLDPRHASEPAACRAEAESVLGLPASALPDDVFARPGS